MKLKLAILCVLIFPAGSWCQNPDTYIQYKTPLAGSFVLVPAGRFQRDANPENISIITRSFLLGTHEISRKQYEAVMGLDPSDNSFTSGSKDDPVHWISWYNAIAFCNKLSLMEGLTPVYSIAGLDFAKLTHLDVPNHMSRSTPEVLTMWNGVTADWEADGYRLPTEMEWMWAAMGADTAAPGQINTTGYAKAFSGSTGSNNISDYVHLSRTYATIPVASKLPNELGIHDMSGNVTEWCWDIFEHDGTYLGFAIKGTAIDYRGGSTGTNRVSKGGSYDLIRRPADLLLTMRDGAVFHRGQYSNTGFRIARNFAQ